MAAPAPEEKSASSETSKSTAPTKKRGQGKPNALALLAASRKNRQKKREGIGSNQKKKISANVLRIQQDFDNLELPQLATLNVPNKENLTEFKVSITADSGYWKGATYTFNFKMPDSYPHSAPSVKCETLIYHPNIDLQGNVCLNLLKDDWRPILEIQHIIQGLIFLFLEPNEADPLNLEAAKVLRNDGNQFRQNVNTSLNGGYVGNTKFPKMNLKEI